MNIKILSVEGPKWSGVDETVVNKFAEEAGRGAWKSLLPTDQGDLLLFMFLLAGLAAGFVIGYYFRVLFSEKQEKNKPTAKPQRTQRKNR